MPTVLQFQDESTDGSLDLELPGGAGVGGYAIVGLTSDGAADTFAAVESGWTEAFINTAGNDYRSVWYVRQITETPPSSWGFTCSDSNFGGRLVVVMPESGEVFDAAAYAGADNTSTDTPATTGVTNVANPRVWLGFFTNDTNFTVTTPPSGGTIVGTVHGSGGTTTASACYQIANPADVGTITRSLTWSGWDSTVAFAVLVSFTEGGDPDPTFNPAWALGSNGIL